MNWCVLEEDSVKKGQKDEQRNENMSTSDRGEHKLNDGDWKSVNKLGNLLEEARIFDSGEWVDSEEIKDISYLFECKFSWV